MTELVLSKDSSESEIKRYFYTILELSKSDNEFPVSLDEVWMLVYGRKEEAVRALTSSEQFIENVDYQVLRKNAEKPSGGRPINEYKLTVSCMEFFIARKVRPVFEVYRQVFHKMAKHELSRKELALMVIQAEEEKERLALENEKQQKQIEKLQPKADFADAAFKKILFSFGSMESLRNFVPFTDDDCIRYVKQAVKLLISYMGFFYALIGYWRLPLRKIIVFALVANAPSVNSVKCNRFLFDKVATYNFL